MAERRQGGLLSLLVKWFVAPTQVKFLLGGLEKTVWLLSEGESFVSASLSCPLTFPKWRPEPSAGLWDSSYWLCVFFSYDPKVFKA